MLGVVRRSLGVRRDLDADAVEVAEAVDRLVVVDPAGNGRRRPAVGGEERCPAWSLELEGRRGSGARRRRPRRRGRRRPSRAPQARGRGARPRARPPPRSPASPRARAGCRRAAPTPRTRFLQDRRKGRAPARRRARAASTGIPRRAARLAPGFEAVLAPGEPGDPGFDEEPRPVSASSSRQRSRARHAEREYQESSPCAYRIRRDSPPEAAPRCPGSWRS